MQIGSSLRVLACACIAAMSPALAHSQSGPAQARPASVFRVETVVSGLDTPWDMAWGPDGELWATERGGRVVRVDVSKRRLTEVGRVEGVTEVGESGLMGMAFHPDFAREPWIYLAHSYGDRSAVRNRLIRLRYENGRLGRMQVLLHDIPGRLNHNGSRLVIGPDRLLYMTMGEAGQRSQAQDRNSLGGKILRLTLDGKPAPGNPFGNYVWSFGHRNPQGLVFRGDVLYSAEHGPDESDEVNRIERGRNYGWPDVSGVCEGGEVKFCERNSVVPPIATYTPTIGIAGLDFYDATLIPGWKGSLLYAALRGTRLGRIKLSSDGRTAESEEHLLVGEYGRLRDVLVGRDGSVYIATSTSRWPRAPRAGRRPDSTHTAVTPNPKP
jgi:aldose sugar dehydrogenase